MITQLATNNNVLFTQKIYIYTHVAKVPEVAFEFT